MSSNLKSSGVVSFELGQRIQGGLLTWTYDSTSDFTGLVPVSFYTQLILTYYLSGIDSSGLKG